MLDSIFTVDVEDWFNLSGSGSEPPPNSWDTMETRVERNFHAILDILAECRSSATCFFVGYFARRFPHLVREAVNRGHEIASHGYYHRMAYELAPDEFRTDARESRELLEDIGGRAVVGYRAPAFSVTKATPWYFACLIEAGYHYDSSVFPAPHQTGGYSGGSLGPYVILGRKGQLIEFPISAVNLHGPLMCFFGGGYLRLFPYALVSRMAKRVLSEGRPVIFYVHPREIDPAQPRLPVSLRRRFTSYVNLDTTKTKLERILSEFPTTSFEKYLTRHSIPAEAEVT